MVGMLVRALQKDRMIEWANIDRKFIRLAHSSGCPLAGEVENSSCPHPGRDLCFR